MPVTPAELWKLLQDSRLIPRRDTGGGSGLRPGPAAAGHHRRRSTWLVREQLLTRYQAEQLLRGRGGPFFYGAYRVLDRVRGGRLRGLFRAVHEPIAVLRAAAVRPAPRGPGPAAMDERSPVSAVPRHAGPSPCSVCTRWKTRPATGSWCSRIWPAQVWIAGAGFRACPGRGLQRHPHGRLGARRTARTAAGVRRRAAGQFVAGPGGQPEIAARLRAAAGRSRFFAAGSARIGGAPGGIRGAGTGPSRHATQSADRHLRAGVHVLPAVQRRSHPFRAERRTTSWSVMPANRCRLSNRWGSPRRWRTSWPA